MRQGSMSNEPDRDLRLSGVEDSASQQGTQLLVNVDQRTTASVVDQDFDENLLDRPALIHLMPHNGVGAMTIRELLEKTNQEQEKTFTGVKIYSFLYSVNQADGVLRAWTKPTEPVNDMSSAEVPFEELNGTEHPDKRMADAGMTIMEKASPGRRQTANEVDSQVLWGTESGQVVVGVFIRTLDSQQELKRTKEGGLEGSWTTRDVVQEEDGIQGGDGKPILIFYEPDEMRGALLKGFGVVEDFQSRVTGAAGVAAGGGNEN